MVVIAGSVEGIDALVRLINSLPSTFLVPVVAYVHGLHKASSARLMRNKADAPMTLDLIVASNGEQARSGCVYVAPVGRALAFTALDTIGLMDLGPTSGADHLFESAARWYGTGVVGVVLSGTGKDGTQGLQAITRAGGTRVVQSPSEASFTGMPVSALLGDNVEYAVMLDQMGALLQMLVAPPSFEDVVCP